VYYEICNEPNTSGEQAGVDWHQPDDRSSPFGRNGPAQPAPDCGGLRPALCHPAQSIRACLSTTSITLGLWLGRRVELLDHYYDPPRALALDETTGFPVHLNATEARLEAWEVLIGGCAVYDHLSWAYTPTDEAGETPENHAFLVQLQKVSRGSCAALILSACTPIQPSWQRVLGTTCMPGHWLSRGEQYAVYIHRGRGGLDTCYRVSEVGSSTRYSDEIGLWILQAITPWPDQTRNRETLATQNIETPVHCWS